LVLVERVYLLLRGFLEVARHLARLHLLGAVVVAEGQEALAQQAALAAGAQDILPQAAQETRRL
jgi:hypothetical protein